MTPDAPSLAEPAAPTSRTAFRPLLKWPGGKAREWPRIRAWLPATVRHLVDPFTGGGAPFALTPFTGHAQLNDRHERLIDLHRRVQAEDTAFFGAARALGEDWERLGGVADEVADEFASLLAAARTGDVTPPAAGERALARAELSLAPLWGARLGELLSASLADKARRLARLERKHGVRFEGEKLTPHGETAVRAAYYTLVRARERSTAGAAGTADFLFVRDFCYGSMFRTNSKGEFNIPYGGASYNGKSFLRRVAQLESGAVRARLARATFHCTDFEEFLAGVATDLDERDLVFLDPPYHSDFSTYGKYAFTLADHERLAAAAARLPCCWLLVIKETPDVRRIYLDREPALRGARLLATFGKQYGYNVRGRNDRTTQHLLIANYDPASPVVN